MGNKAYNIHNKIELMIYFIIGIILILPIFIFDTKANFNFQKSNLYYYMEMIVLILFAGLRNGVGGDTFSYMSYWNLDFYENISSLNYSILLLLDRFGPGWIILSSIVKSLTDEFFVFQIIHAIIINVGIFYFVNRCTSYKFTVIFLYFLTTYFFYNMEIMRQSLANIFILLSLFSFVEKQWKKYYVLIIIATLFHASAIIFILMPLFYNLLKRPLTSKTVVLFCVLALIFQTSITSLNLGESWADGAEKYSEMSVSSTVGTIHRLVLGIVFYYMAKYVSNNKCFNEVIKFGTNIFFIFNLMGIFMPIFITRYSTVYSIVLYIVMAMMLIQKHKTIIKPIIWAEFVFFTLIKAYTVDMTSWVGGNESYYFYNLYYPYYSIFEQNVENEKYYKFRYNAMHANE